MGSQGDEAKKEALFRIFPTVGKVPRFIRKKPFRTEVNHKGRLAHSYVFIAVPGKTGKMRQIKEHCMVL